MSLRSIRLFIAPVLSFAIVVWVVLCILFGFPGQELKATSLGFLAFVSAGVCRYTSLRLYPRRAVSDFRAAYVVNAAGFATILIWFVLMILSGVWQHLIHRAA